MSYIKTNASIVLHGQIHCFFFCVTVCILYLIFDEDKNVFLFSFEVVFIITQATTLSSSKVSQKS